MEVYLLFCRYMAVFHGLASDRRFARFGKLWSSFDMGVKARIKCAEAAGSIFTSTFHIRVEQIRRGELAKRKNV